jgi:hypothetical protein
MIKSLYNDRTMVAYNISSFVAKLRVDRLAIKATKKQGDS